MCDYKKYNLHLTREYNYFRLALGFFSRIPMGNSVNYQREFMHACTRYFPTIGWLLAIILCGFYILSTFLFNDAVAVGLIMIISVLITGALHEDGLADTCDGFWGGLSVERKIDIMKDSRIGTYGACGLVLILGLKYSLLLSLSELQHFELAILIAYPLSRALALSHVQDLPYVGNQGSVSKNKSDPLAKPVSMWHLLFVMVTGSLALLMLSIGEIAILCAIVLAVRYLLRHWMKHHIGGYSGDVLGAAQQIQEIVIYLVLLSFLE